MDNEQKKVLQICFSAAQIRGLKYSSFAAKKGCALTMNQSQVLVFAAVIDTHVFCFPNVKMFQVFKKSLPFILY